MNSNPGKLQTLTLFVRLKLCGVQRATSKLTPNPILQSRPILNPETNYIMNAVALFYHFKKVTKLPYQPHTHTNRGTCSDVGLFLVLLVNDSEYSQSTGAKPIFRSLLAVFISFPLARCAPHPTPPPLFGGGKVPRKKPKKKKIVCVCCSRCVKVYRCVS